MNPIENEIELTLLMPCLNEAATLERCIAKARAGLERLGIAGEILIADNGSDDGSPELARRCGARVTHVAEKGYGAALLGGIEAARGRYVIMADADDSYDWSAIDPFVERLRSGCDLVMGCRLPAGGGRIEPGAMPWTHRWIGNPALSFIGRLFFDAPVTDFHCGMRGFRREAIRGLDLHTTGMEFASEMVIRASLAKLNIAQVPITLHPDARGRPPHLRTWRDGWRHLRFMLMFSPTWLFLLPGALLMLLGLLGFALILPAPLTIGGLTFDVNTLLICSLAILIGFQVVAFGVMARVFAMTEGFLPPDRRWERMFRTVRLESGLLVGLGVVGLGALLFAAAMIYWASRDFGDLPYPVGLRMVIPSATMIALGVQIVFSSFFLSLLGMKRR